jgi:hypothetical protein
MTWLQNMFSLLSLFTMTHPCLSPYGVFTSHTEHNHNTKHTHIHSHSHSLSLSHMLTWVTTVWNWVRTELEDFRFSTSSETTWSILKIVSLGFVTVFSNFSLFTLQWLLTRSLLSTSILTKQTLTKFVVKDINWMISGRLRKLRNTKYCISESRVRLSIISF